MIFIAGVVVLVFTLAGFSAWLNVKRSKESQFGLPVTPEKEEKKIDLVRVTVTYNDGKTEVFEKDGEIEYNEGGLLIIRLEGRCVTISPFAFRKVEELHI